MPNRGDDGGLAATIPALPYLRSYDFFQRGGESNFDDWRHHRSIKDAQELANLMIAARGKGATTAGCFVTCPMDRRDRPAWVDLRHPGCPYPVFSARASRTDGLWHTALCPRRQTHHG